MRIILDALDLKGQQFLENNFTGQVTDGATGQINIEKTKDVIKLSKQSSSKDLIEDEFTFRIKKAGTSIELWPIALNSTRRGSLIAEIEINGHRMVNMVVQNELIDISNEWVKNIHPTHTSRDVVNSKKCVETILDEFIPKRC